MLHRQYIRFHRVVRRRPSEVVRAAPVGQTVLEIMAPFVGGALSAIGVYSLFGCTYCGDILCSGDCYNL